MTLQERIRGRNIGIIGMARSGMAAARLIKRMGGTPFVSDVKSSESLTKQIGELKTFNIEFETDGHTDRLFESDFVILSPGVPKESEFIQKIIGKGIPLFSEIELAYWFCSGRVIAITGSNGKTTTTSLIGAMLSSAGINNVVCGNIGHPFSDAVLEIGEEGYAVVEVSNFQLELIEEFTPFISIILNLTPDHLDRYENFDGYKKAKYRIAENQTSSDYLILNGDDSVIEKNNIGTKAKKIYFSTKQTLPTGVFQRGKSLVGIVGGEEINIIDVDKIRIPGPHNLQNAAAASLAALLAGAKPECITDALKSFPGVEHRLEDVTQVSGIKFVNDSKATNVDAVCYALKSFDAPICLIAGGRDKGGDFEPIVNSGRDKIKEIILIGEARDKMFNTLGKAFPVQFAENMEAAVNKAFTAASPGDIILLSPACASFDMFDNFEHRGKVFKKAVLSLTGNNHITEEVGR
ncbi:MAG: UDP-N-acetylmuramoyl-L-alanine--D-glutamate ligase [Candidatus Zixiibacteriota bacterium]